MEQMEELEISLIFRIVVVEDMDIMMVMEQMVFVLFSIIKR